MLRRMVSLNRMVSCVTTAIWLRKSRVATSRMSVAADPNRALLWIVEAEQQIGKCRLARTAGPDERHQLAGLHGQIDIREDGLLAVGKLQIAQNARPHRRH